MNPGSNLIEMALGLFTPERVRKLSSVLGEAPDQTKSALQAGVPAVMAGMVDKGATESGARELISMIREGGYDSTDPSDILQQLGTNQTQGLMQKGQQLLSSLLGSKANALLDAVARFSGVNKVSSGNILSMAAPVLMSFVGKKASAENFNPSALANLLGSQKQSLAAMLPAGIGAALGGGWNLAGLAPQRMKISNVWPYVVAGLLALVAVSFWQRAGRHQQENSSTSGEVARNKPQGPIPPQIPPPPEVRPETPPPAAVAEQPSVEVIRELSEFIVTPEEGATPKKFVLRDLKFESGGTRLTSSSAKVVNQLADVLKDHETVQVRLEGHTDSTGSPQVNAKLSKARANAIREQLSKQGVDRKRIETAGMGELNPLSDNDTPEGRLNNRRVEIIVVKR